MKAAAELSRRDEDVGKVTVPCVLGNTHGGAFVIRPPIRDK